jgi:hypothetical protein
MAFGDRYTQGTVSTDADSPADPKKIIGSGTLWSATAVAGDLFWSGGIAAPIASVDSDTQLTLATDWPGSALDGASYSIEFLSGLRHDATDLAGRVRDLINRLRVFDAASPVFSVLTFGVNDPPTDAVVEDRYVIGTSPTSDFVGHDNEIVEKTETGWLFRIPEHGWQVVDEAENKVRSFTGSAWEEVTGADGAAATVTVGTVTTGDAGSNAAVTNAGTSSAAVLNFAIPRGDTGQGLQPDVTVNEITSTASPAEDDRDAHDSDPEGTIVLVASERKIYVRLTSTAGVWSDGVSVGGSSIWFNVKDHGVVGDGTADDATAIQDAIDACLAAGGGTVYFPPGSYKTTSQLLIDLSTESARFAKRIMLRGDGVASALFPTGLADSAVKYLGKASNPEAYFAIEGLRISGNSTADSVGLETNIAAFVSVRNCVIEAFDVGWDATDTEQAGLYDSEVRYNGIGLRMNAAVATSSPNSITIINSSISNNIDKGIDVTNANSLNMLGGSIQYNGPVDGTSSQGGAVITEAGNGYGTVMFAGVAFEGNGGAGDVVSDQTTNPVRMTWINCSFFRTTAFGPTVGYGTNNINAKGSNANSLYSLIGGNTFRYGVGYTESGSRPTIALNNTNAKIYDDGTNYFESATEKPTYQTSQIAALYREKLTANRTYYVRTDGSDSNTGLSDTSGGAFLTKQKAINVVAALDIGIFDVTINVADGTYTGGVQVNGPWTGLGNVYLVGNSTTPANCVISTSGNAILVTNNGTLNIEGFKLASSGAIGLAAQYGATVNVTGKMECGACGIAQIYTERFGRISIASDYTISGAAPIHCQALTYGYVFNVTNTITITGTPAFSTAFAYCTRTALMEFASNTFSGAATGARYNAGSGGGINTFGGGATYFPGDTAGSATTPGWYE